MFDSSDVQSVFSGNIAEEWEKKSRYINSKDFGSWLWDWKIVKSD